MLNLTLSDKSSVLLRMFLGTKLTLFLLVFRPLLILLSPLVLVSNINSRVHGRSRLHPAAGIQISRQGGVRIKPILTNGRLFHFFLEPISEKGDPGKHGRDVSLKGKNDKCFVGEISE